MAATWRTPASLDRSQIADWLEELSQRQERVRVACVQQRLRAEQMRRLAMQLRRDVRRFGVGWDTRTNRDS
jgi:hypothetical protein